MKEVFVLKKIISMFLCLIMVSVLLTPVVGFAAVDKGLENAIKIAKSKFDIPEKSTFNFDVLYTRFKKSMVFKLGE